MAGKLNGPSIASRTWWRLAGLLSRVLEPEERDAVLGDITESGESGAAAARDLLGLVARRQAAQWTHWQPWVILSTLIVPLGMLLSIIALDIATQGAIYSWMYLNNWHWSYLGDRGFWFVLQDSGVPVLLAFVTLACWSWTSGFLLGIASRRMVAMNGLLLALSLIFGILVGAPWYFETLSRHLPFRLHGAGNDPVFDLLFYRAIFPLIVQAILALVPALFGMSSGARSVDFRIHLRVLLGIMTIIAIAGFIMHEPGLIFLLSGGAIPRILSGSQLRLLQPITYWPIAYLLITAIATRVHRQALQPKESTT